jgi:hypothetical protein
MASNYVGTLLNSLEPNVKRVLQLAFDYVQATFRLGTDNKATNANWYRMVATTSSNANTEFSVAHGMDAVPTTLIPVLDLNAVGSQLVPLTASRAPDAKRVYLTSSSTGAVITFYLE